MQRGEATFWMMLTLSTAGLIVPHLLAVHGMGSAKIVRMMALPLFILSGSALADHHLLGGAILRSIANL
jgi:hypothetical protein